MDLLILYSRIRVKDKDKPTVIGEIIEQGLKLVLLIFCRVMKLVNDKNLIKNLSVALIEVCRT